MFFVLWPLNNIKKKSNTYSQQSRWKSSPPSLGWGLCKREVLLPMLYNLYQVSKKLAVSYPEGSTLMVHAAWTQCKDFSTHWHIRFPWIWLEFRALPLQRSLYPLSGFDKWERADDASAEVAGPERCRGKGLAQLWRGKDGQAHTKCCSSMGC